MNFQCIETTAIQINLTENFIKKKYIYIYLRIQEQKELSEMTKIWSYLQEGQNKIYQARFVTHDHRWNQMVENFISYKDIFQFFCL